MPYKKSVSDNWESNKPLISVSRFTTCRIPDNTRNWRRDSRQWVNCMTTPASKSTFKSTGTTFMAHSHIFSDCDCVSYRSIAWDGLYGCQWYCSESLTSISGNLIQKRSYTQEKNAPCEWAIKVWLRNGHTCCVIFTLWENGSCSNVK